MDVEKGVRSAAGDLARLFRPIQRMESYLVPAFFLQIKFLEDYVIMGGEEYLNTHSLQFQQDINYHAEESWIKIGFRLIPEQYRALLQRSIPEQNPQQTELAYALGE